MKENKIELTTDQEILLWLEKNFDKMRILWENDNGIEIDILCLRLRISDKFNFRYVSFETKNGSRVTLNSTIQASLRKKLRSLYLDFIESEKQKLLKEMKSINE